MQRISLVDETFDLNYTLEYQLSIQLGLDGFSFSILDSTQNKVVYLFHQELFEAEPEFLLKRIKAIYEESDLLELPFKYVRILISAPGRTCLMPEKFFIQTEAENSFNTTFLPRKHHSIRATRIPAYRQWAMYDAPEVILNFLEEKHRGAEIVNDLRITCPDFAPDQNRLRVTLLKKHLVLTATDALGISFCNSFFYDSDNDLLYFILGAAKQLEKEPELIVLDGMVNKHSTVYHRLRQYFTNVEMAQAPRNLNLSYLFEKLPDARFVTLFNSFVCA